MWILMASWQRPPGRLENVRPRHLSRLSHAWCGQNWLWWQPYRRLWHVALDGTDCSIWAGRWNPTGLFPIGLLLFDLCHEFWGFMFKLYIYYGPLVSTKRTYKKHCSHFSCEHSGFPKKIWRSQKQKHPRFPFKNHVKHFWTKWSNFSTVVSGSRCWSMPPCWILLVPSCLASTKWVLCLGSSVTCRYEQY